MKTLTKIAVAAALVAPFAAPLFASADSSSTYYKCGRGYYSDTPRGLKAALCSVKSVRTGGTIQTASTPARPMTLAEQQAQLNQKVAAENKRIEEANKKREADTKAENCKMAQINLQTAQGARNKGDLLPKYQADVSKYCN